MKKWVYVFSGIIIGIICGYGTVCFIRHLDAIGALAMGFAVVILAIVILLSSPMGLNLGDELSRIPCELDGAKEGNDYEHVEGDVVVVLCDKGVRIWRNDKIYSEFFFKRLLGLNIADESIIAMINCKRYRYLYEFKVDSLLKRRVLDNTFLQYVDERNVRYE